MIALSHFGLGLGLGFKSPRFFKLQGSGKQEPCLFFNMYTQMLSSCDGCWEMLLHCLIKWFKSSKILLQNVMENMHVTEYIQWEPSAFKCFQKKNAKPCLAKTCAFILFQWHFNRHTRSQNLIFLKYKKYSESADYFCFCKFYILVREKLYFWGKMITLFLMLWQIIWRFHSTEL